MEEASVAPSSLADYGPKRLRASGRDGAGLVSRAPSPLSMLFSRHTKRRDFITLLGGAAISAADDAGLAPARTSGLRDDCRQSITSGNKAPFRRRMPQHPRQWYSSSSREKRSEAPRNVSN